jgi:acyl carrier protein
MTPDDVATMTAPAGAVAVDASTELAILGTISELIVQIIGEEYVLDLEIGPDTSFNADLELESIEFVALAAKLREHYGDRVDFVAFLADKEVSEIIELTVGELVAYIAASLRGRTANDISGGTAR